MGRKKRHTIALPGKTQARCHAANLCCSGLIVLRLLRLRGGDDLNDSHDHPVDLSGVLCADHRFACPALNGLPGIPDNLFAGTGGLQVLRKALQLLLLGALPRCLRCPQDSKLPIQKMGLFFNFWLIELSSPLFEVFRSKTQVLECFFVWILKKQKCFSTNLICFPLDLSFIERQIGRSCFSANVRAVLAA